MKFVQLAVKEREGEEEIVILFYSYLRVSFIYLIRNLKSRKREVIIKRLTGIRMHRSLYDYIELLC